MVYAVLVGVNVFFAAMNWRYENYTISSACFAAAAFGLIMEISR